jgi:hypothetical protein
MGLLSWLSWSPRGEEEGKESTRGGTKSTRAGSTRTRNGHGSSAGGTRAPEVDTAVETKEATGSGDRKSRKDKPERRRAGAAGEASRRHGAPAGVSQTVGRRTRGDVQDKKNTHAPDLLKERQNGKHRKNSANGKRGRGQSEESGGSLSSDESAEIKGAPETGETTPLEKKARGTKHTPATPYSLPSHFTKSLWKVRPLQVDEKLRVFIEGKDDGCDRFDGGEFQQWLSDCKAGRSDPLEAGAYPLVVQDSDLRHLLEIKYPSERAVKTLEAEYFDKIKPQTSDKGKKQREIGRRMDRHDIDAGPETAGMMKIQIPHWRILPRSEWPDAIIRRNYHTIPVLVRTPGGGAERLDRKVPKKVDENQHERAYIRYMQPTPDDWDQAIEYDLDEDDEKWLDSYNRRAKNANDQHVALKEEWLEHLIDRMDKEYTNELQKHPEKWICKPRDENHGGKDAGSSTFSYMKGQLPPPLILPSISEVFPLSVCLKVFDREVASPSPAVSSKKENPSSKQNEKIIKDVYNYWKKKHQKSGLPLIQRLWYEPPWHRKASEEDINDGEETANVFAGYDVPSTLSRIRKRRMNDAEVQLRFDCLRRDFEMVRTIADLIRRREKLKLQETSLLKLEWAARMKEISRAPRGRGGSPAQSRLCRPPKLASLLDSKRSAVASREHPQDVRAKKEQMIAIERTLSEDRAARLAARRDVRAEALRARRERGVRGSAESTKNSASKTRSGKRSAVLKRSSSRKKTLTKRGATKQPRSSTGQFQSFRK